jgi:hypothetical protein
VIALYAVTDASGPPLPDATSPLCTIATRELAAICAPASKVTITPEVLWRHEQVVEDLMEDRDLLPVRFGTRAPDEASVSRILEENYDRLIAGLEFVRGAVEISMRAYTRGEQPAASAPAEATTGTEYLRARARDVAARREVVRAIHEPLATEARADTLRHTGAPEEILRAAYLVDRRRLSHFQDLVAAVQDANPGVRLVSTGPWPPYSFAER